jgi:hypothetical protein
MKRSLALLTFACLLCAVIALGLAVSISAAPPLRPTPTPGVPSPQDALQEPGGAGDNLPDLVITDISVDEPARPDVTTTVRVVVKNRGRADVKSGNNFYVDLYIDPAAPPEAGRPGEPGTLYQGVQGYLLKAGASVPLSFQYVFTRTRSYDLYARADTDGDVIEADEYNNILGPRVVEVRPGYSFADVNHEDFQAGFSNMDLSHPAGLIALGGIYEEPFQETIGISPALSAPGSNIYNPDIGVSHYVNRVNQVAPAMAREPGAGGRLFVVWEDGRNGELNNRDIYFAMSEDSGATWIGETRVNQDPAGVSVNQRAPTLVYSNGALFAAWQDNRRGNYDIWFARSRDNGQTWVERAGPINDDAGGADQMNPSLAVDDAGTLFIVWQDRRNGNDDIYFAASSDGGQTWTRNILVTDQPGSTSQSQRSPAIAVAGQNIYVVWEDGRSAGYGDPADIYFTIGRKCEPPCDAYSFGIDRRVNDDETKFAQRDPSIAISAPTIEISHTQVFTPGSSICTTPPPVTTEVTFHALYEGVATHFVWQDFRQGVDSPEIYYAWKFEPIFTLKQQWAVPGEYGCPADPPFQPEMRFPYGDAEEIFGNKPISDLPPLTPASCLEPPYGASGVPCDPPVDPNAAGDHPKHLYSKPGALKQFPTLVAGPPHSDLVYILWSDERNFDDWSSRIYMARPLRERDGPEYEVLDNIIVNDNPKLLPLLSGDGYLRNAPASVRQYRPAGAYSSDTDAPYVVWDDDRRANPLAGYALNRNIFFARPGAPPSPGVFMSRIFAANDETHWRLLEWWGVTPIGTKLFFQTRTGNTPWPDATWTEWTGPTFDPEEEMYVYQAPGEIVGPGGQLYPKARYFQYRVWMTDCDIEGLPRNWKPPYTQHRLPQAWVSKVLVHYSPKIYVRALPLVVKS